MQLLNKDELAIASGAGLVADAVYEVGYGVGYAGGYFYKNVMTSNRWLDDVADLLLPQEGL